MRAESSSHGRLRFDSDPSQIRFRLNADPNHIRLRFNSDSIQIRFRIHQNPFRNANLPKEAPEGPSKTQEAPEDAAVLQTLFSSVSCSWIVMDSGG